jgi:hypothetical protein
MNWSWRLDGRCRIRFGSRRRGSPSLNKSLMIKFEDHFVEQSDPLKGEAIMIFRRIFSNTMRPEDGFVIDKEGQPPEIYAARQAPNAFEKDLWKRFWEIANDERLAKEYGVRAIHGDAPYMRLEPDRVYEIVLRSTGKSSSRLERDCGPQNRSRGADRNEPEVFVDRCQYC